MTNKTYAADQNTCSGKPISTTTTQFNLASCTQTSESSSYLVSCQAGKLKFTYFSDAYCLTQADVLEIYYNNCVDEKQYEWEFNSAISDSLSKCIAGKDSFQSLKLT